MKEKNNELLIKILVQYGEQCHADGYITEMNLSTTLENIERCYKLTKKPYKDDGIKHFVPTVEDMVERELSKRMEDEL